MRPVDLSEVRRVLLTLLPGSEYGAVLFGSRATGHALPGSDWDIGIVGPAAVRGAVVERIREALEEMPTLHTFDVVDLMSVPQEFREAALSHAVRIA